MMMGDMVRHGYAELAVAAFAFGLGGCTPVVKVEVPDKPIEINLNIRIEQEVRVKVERDLDDAIRSDPALFGLPPATVAPTGKGTVAPTAKGKEKS